MAALAKAEGFDAYNEDHLTGQVAIDAIRFALGGQKDPAQRIRIVETLLEFAPPTADDHGLELIRRLIVEGTLAVQVTP